MKTCRLNARCLMMALAMMIFSTSTLSAQTEVMGWGNMTGIRVDGELIEFESSMRIASKEWNRVFATGKERQQGPVYTRDSNTQKVVTTFERVRFEQTVTDRSKGVVDVSVAFTSDTTIQNQGLYFAISLPKKRYSDAIIAIGNAKINVETLTDANNKNPKILSSNKILVQSIDRKLELQFPARIKAFVRKESDGAATIYIELASQKLTKGESKKINFTINASGTIDNETALIALDTQNPGRLFQGLGGNFRLQNARVDPQVIDYCLENLPVSWGRVEMPWRNWQPEEGKNPITEARAGRIDPRVVSAMEMAQRLAAKGMPVIVSAWFPPTWAIVPGTGRTGGVRAYELQKSKEAQIYKSLTDYLVYLKQEYGVEAVMFSFNESDIGIDVLHSADEHRDFIKGLGSYMASRGLATKMLLGDNSDATTYNFITPAMNDPETHKYIGAVSFHSWRGCDNETLKKWGDAAKTLNVPLIIGEGSTDAAAHRYPQIFAESTFALYEINLYTRICAISQPLSIIQWQLTSDYSIVWGDGVYGSTGPIVPTQRFWNLKQLAETPRNSFAIPFTCNKEEVNSAAFGNIARGEYTVHMVNNGAARKAIIKDLPASVTKVKVYGTNSEIGMKNLGTLDVVNGTVSVDLPAITFISLYSIK